MIIPQLLKPGDTVGIVAPARKISPADVEFAAAIISGWGFEVVLADHIYSNRHSYLAGSDEERRSDLQAMISNPLIRCILCARGGYGSTRIIDTLDYSPLFKNNKWIVGFSDITALHLNLVKQGITSIHGAMPIIFSQADATPSLESLCRLLTTGSSNLEAAGSPYNRTGDAVGRVIGGNLSLVANALGTYSDPDTHGRILVLEEIDEYFYTVDRMLTQLKRAGKLKNLSGLVIGHMTGIKETTLAYGERVEEVVLNVVKDYDYPVAFKFPSGHENPNLAWLHGGTAKLTVNAAGSRLSFDQYTG